MKIGIYTYGQNFLPKPPKFFIKAEYDFKNKYLPVCWNCRFFCIINANFDKKNKRNKKDRNNKSQYMFVQNSNWLSHSRKFTVNMVHFLWKFQ